MSRSTRWLRLLSMLALGSLALGVPSVGAKEFTFDEKANAEIARKLHRPRAVEAKLMGELLPLGFRHGLAHNLAQRIAERSPDGKGDDQDCQHDERRLHEAAPDKGKTRGDGCHGSVRLRLMPLEG